MTNTFKESFYFFQKNSLKLLLYTFSIGLLIVFLATLIVPVFFSDMGAQEINTETIKPFAQLLDLLVKPIYTGGLVTLIYALAMGNKASIANSLFSGIVRWPYMLVANVLTSILVFAGLMAFFLPGIWIFSRLFLVPYLIILKKQTPFSALIQSYQYTKGYSLVILTDMSFLIIFFIVTALSLDVLQLTHPILLLILLLLFQTMAYVIYYRHYEILEKKFHSRTDITPPV